MSRSIALAAGVAAALAVYFALSVYVLPQSYQASLVPRRPDPVITDVNVPAKVTLGQPVAIKITAINNGEEADAQLVSVGFPNLTSTANNIKVLNHNFRQTPILISKGTMIGSEYSGGEKTVAAQYAIVEALSRPWTSHNSYSLSLQVTPKSTGQFVLFIKTVAFPNSDRAHWPVDGLVDYQKEFVKPYYIEVTKKA